MTAPMNVLSSRRTVLLAVLAKHEQFLAEFDPERDAIEINIRIAKVQKLSVDLEAIQAKLEDAAATEEVISHNAALRDDFGSRLIRLEAHLMAKRVHAPRSASTTPNTNPLAGIKLPTISLPEFDGDYMQWLTYRDTFEGLIHENIELPPIQKFHYLRASVKGEAAKVIEAITISAANYELAWQMLTERYSNEYLLKKRHLQALFGMATVKKESASTLHHLVDEFEHSASQPDLMSSRFANRLGIKSGTVDITLIGAGQSSTPVRKSMRTTVSSRASPYAINVEFLIVEKLIADLPAHDVPTSGWKLPPHIIFADPHFDKSAPIDIILGA
ncbi:uncharacterized protein LOC121591381 [Anopheles merus]|uniref:uncharacterized protein LOC121591381 n=1 Tax=Anopheles merus TaxID=30066 RepID=UPI001BE4ADDD|nr:uncharacterized protein LOC121591381 [Anopheles merus]